MFGTVASAREWDFTAQIGWWYCAVAHLRGKVGERNFKVWMASRETIRFLTLR